MWEIILPLLRSGWFMECVKNSCARSVIDLDLYLLIFEYTVYFNVFLKFKSIINQYIQIWLLDSVYTRYQNYNKMETS